MGKTSLIVVLVAAAGVGAWLYVRANVLPGRTEAVAKPDAATQGPSGIACLGRIEPKDGIASISARGISGQPSIVGQLKVHEGDLVKAGQVVAVMDSNRELEEVVHNLKVQVAVAQSRLAVAKTGVMKKGDLAAQQAEIARLEAGLAAARIQADRYEQLYQKQAATVIERDQRRLDVETTTQMLNAARSRLLSLQDDVRDVDVKLAEAEVQAAMANVTKAEADVEPSIVHAPFTGRILKIHAWPGEEVGPKGILELARTEQMYVVAEVPETDVGRVRIGEKATIKGDGLAEPLQGAVESIGTQVTRENIEPTDPQSFTDARIVEVRIRLDESSKAAHLIHGKVTALIEP